MRDRSARWPSMRTSAGFAVPNLLPVALAFLAAPVLIHELGADTWGQLIAAQVLGGFGAVVVAMGWPILGPTAVAISQPKRRPDLLAASMGQRTMALVLAAGPVAAVSAVVIGPWWVTSTLAVATTLNGLNSQWYFVGAVEPSRLVLFDAIPRSIGIVAGVTLVALQGSAGPYVLCVAAGIAAAVVLPAIAVLNGHERAPVEDRSGDRLSSTVTSVVANTYVGAPLIAVTILQPKVLPVYAMADRLYAVAILFLATYIQSLQGWVPADPSRQDQRETRALRSTAVVSVVVALALFLGIPVAATFLSAGSIAVPFAISGGLAIAAAWVVLSQYIGLVVLTSRGQVRTVALSTLVGAAVGLPLIVGATLVTGGAGAAWAFALSELAVFAVQWRRFRALAVERRTPGLS